MNIKHQLLKNLLAELPCDASVSKEALHAIQATQDELDRLDRHADLLFNELIDERKVIKHKRQMIDALHVKNGALLKDVETLENALAIATSGADKEKTADTSKTKEDEQARYALSALLVAVVDRFSRNGLVTVSGDLLRDFQKKGKSGVIKLVDDNYQIFVLEADEVPLVKPKPDKK